MARGGYRQMRGIESGRRRVGSVLALSLLSLSTPLFTRPKNTFALLRVLAETIGDAYVGIALET